MAKKKTKKGQGPSIPSETNSNQEEWLTKTSDDEESYENEINVLNEEQELNQLDEFDEANINELNNLNKEQNTEDR